MRTITAWKMPEHYLAYTEFQLKEDTDLSHIQIKKCEAVLVIHGVVYCVVKNTIGLKDLETRKYQSVNYKWETIEEENDMFSSDFTFRKWNTWSEVKVISNIIYLSY